MSDNKPIPTTEWILLNIIKPSHTEKLLRLKSLLEKEIVERCMSSKKSKINTVKGE